MRKVALGVATSLDNYIARKDGTIDWILRAEKAASAMAEFFKAVDTVVMGRKTYEPILKSGAPFPAMPGVRNYVLSRTLEESSDNGVEIIREDAAEFVRKLKMEDSERVIAVTGGLLAKSLFEANLIDEVRVNIHPILLGSGIPIFHETNHQIDLELITCKPFKNGCVLVTYRVKH